MVGFLLLTRCFHIFGQASVTVVKSVAYVLLLHTGSKRGGNTLTKGFAGIWKKKKKGTYSAILLGLFYGLKPAQSSKSKENRKHCAQHQYSVFSGKTAVGSPKEHSGFCGTDRAANT